MSVIKDRIEQLKDIKEIMQKNCITIEELRESWFELNIENRLKTQKRTGKLVNEICKGN